MATYSHISASANEQSYNPFLLTEKALFHQRLQFTAVNSCTKKKMQNHPIFIDFLQFCSIEVANPRKQMLNALKVTFYNVFENIQKVGSGYVYQKNGKTLILNTLNYCIGKQPCLNKLERNELLFICYLFQLLPIEKPQLNRVELLRLGMVRRCAC